MSFSETVLIALIVQVTKIRKVSGGDNPHFTWTTRKGEKTPLQLPGPDVMTAQKHVHMHRNLCTFRFPVSNSLIPESQACIPRTNTVNYLSLPASRAEFERTVACLLL